MKKIFSILLMAIFMLNVQVFAYSVMYNTQTGKYHQIWCRWAKKCTVNCVKIDKKEAVKRGGIPCKVCGG